MAIFFDWMATRDTSTLLRLRLLESADFFRPSDYNPLFDSELAKVIARIYDPDLRRQVSELKIDWAGYLVHSLARAGYKGAELEEAFQSTCVKLLVNSKLFREWQPGKHGPLDRRFRRSVWNAIRNAQEKNRNRRRWMTAVDPSVMAGQYAGRAIYNNIIGEFRGLVFQRLGGLALAISTLR